MRRIEGLIKMLSEKEGILITNPKNAFYFSGIKSSNITLYITKEKRYLITDFRYFEAALKNKYGFCVLYEKNLMDYLKEIVKEESVYLETDDLTYDKYFLIKENIPAILKKADDMISKLRIIKDEEEINNIKEAQKICDKAFLDTIKEIKTGMTELSLKSILEYNMAKYGAEKTSFDTIVLFGKNTSLPHGEPSENRLMENDIILMDFGCVYKGYSSDITRTFFKGNVNDEMKKAYNDVLFAHKKARDGIYEGISAQKADELARDYLYKNGYEGLFGHSLGHGVGLDIHEAPTLSPKSKNTIEKNMTFSIEPGVYFKDKFGIRIENLYYMNENAEVVSFTDLKKNLYVL